MYKDLKELVDINQLRDEAYKCACEHGFHDTQHFDSHWLALIMSEVGEALNADRKNLHANIEGFTRWRSTLHNPILHNQIDNDSSYIADFEYFIKDSVEDELADIAIRILDFAGLRGYDCSEFFDTSVTTLEIPNKDRFSWFCFHLFSIFTDAEDAFDTTDEILDSAAYAIASYCNMWDIDLHAHIVLKMKYNELRPKLNGKAY